MYTFFSRERCLFDCTMCVKIVQHAVGYEQPIAFPCEREKKKNKWQREPYKSSRRDYFLFPVFSLSFDRFVL